MLKAICLTPLLVICLIVSAQKNEKDSLLSILNKSAEDTNKVNQYRKIGASILYQNALEALGYFKQGFILAKKLQFNPGLERCYSAASLAYSINASYDSSLLYNDTAIYYAHKVGNINRLALDYLNRADIYSNLQNYSATIKNCDTALKYAELSGSKDGQARIYSIMVAVYTDQKLYTLALTTLEKVQALFEEVQNKQMVGMTYTDQAYVYVLLNDPDKAIPLYKKAIHIADSLKDYENLSGYTGGLAEAYISKNRFAEAETSARSALKYAEQAGNRRQQGVVYEIFYLINKQQNNFAKAIEYDLHAYTIFKEEKDLLREQGVTANLSEAYFKTGNTLEAYNFLKISNELNDSLLRKQFNDETAKLQTTFEVKQKDKEIELLNKNKELQQQKLLKQRLLMFGAAALALLALTGAWLLMNRNKLRQQMKELELRNQIAADLHDEVGSSLSSIHMLSQMATKQTGSDKKQQDILTRMSTNAKETMDKMGDIVWMIKSNEKETSGLRQRMERFAYEICSSKNIELLMQLDELGEEKFSMEQRKNIYLIAKEAINNAAKYSGTDKIDIITTLTDKNLILSIKDYGKGFEIANAEKGNGLDNMRNRAKELKGSLTIVSEAGKGTNVELSIRT